MGWSCWWRHKYLWRHLLWVMSTEQKLFSLSFFFSFLFFFSLSLSLGLSLLLCQLPDTSWWNFVEDLGGTGIWTWGNRDGQIRHIALYHWANGYSRVMVSFWRDMRSWMFQMPISLQRSELEPFWSHETPPYTPPSGNGIPGWTKISFRVAMMKQKHLFSISSQQY